MEVKQNHLITISHSLTLQGKPDYVEIFERVSKLDKTSFAQISTEELFAYNQVVFYHSVMEEYEKKGEVWWNDSSPQFMDLAYHQLLEKRINLMGGNNRLCERINSILNTQYSDEYILSHREELAEAIKGIRILKQSSVSDLTDLSD